MLEKIKIENFQSHKNTEFELSEGINAITGVSDSGKSSTTRAIEWLALNSTPTGQLSKDNKNKQRVASFQSYWVGKEGTKVSFVFDDNIVAKHRSKTKNGYILNDIDFDVVGRDLPSEVKEFINLDDINIQGQHERYYIMQDTPGQVAGKLNKIANLDIIDFMREEADTALRENSKQITITESKIKDTNENLEKYIYLDEVELLLNALITLSEEQQSLESTIETLSVIITNISETQEDIKLLNEWLEVENEEIPLSNLVNEFFDIDDTITDLQDKVNSIENLQNEIEVVDKIINTEDEVLNLLQLISELTKIKTEETNLSKLINSIENLEISIQALSDQTECEKEVDSLLSTIEEYKTIVVDLRALSELVLKIIKTTNQINEYDEKIIMLTNKVGEFISQNNVCPLCGGDINDDTLEHIKEWL